MGKVIIVCMFVFAFYAPASAQSPQSATQILHDYQLTLPKVEAYGKAYEALIDAAASDETLKADLQAAGAEHAASMADEIAKMTHHPRTFAFFAKEGLSKEDAVTLPLALMGGCMAAQMPSGTHGLPQTSEQQVEFCKANMASIRKLKFVNPAH